MNVKTPKDVTRAVARAQEMLKTSGIEVKYTQMLSAIAAFHGFSNREEYLASVKKDAPAPAGKATDLTADFAALLKQERASGETKMVTVITDGEPAVGWVHKDWTPDQRDARIYGYRPDEDYVPVYAGPMRLPSGLMPQAELLEVVMSVLDRVADGSESFNDICEDTGVSALVSQQQVLLRGGTFAGQPKKGETFIQRLLRMSPAEITHADFRMVVTALKRAFGEIRDARGYEPGWMLPFITVADGLNSESEKLERERAYPYQVVSYASAEAMRCRQHDSLVPAHDLAEAVAEMRRRLDENKDVFGCAALSVDLNHRYYSLVRGIDGEYRELPDGMVTELGDSDTWDEMALGACDMFATDGGLRHETMKAIAEAIEERLRRRAFDEPVFQCLDAIEVRTNLRCGCKEAYGILQSERIAAEERLRVKYEQQVAQAAGETFETDMFGAKFKVIDGVICGQAGDGTWRLRYPGHPCATREQFEASVGYIFQFQW